MLRRIAVKGFQSLEDVNLDLANGITVITGPSRSGKSALVRALKAAVSNATGANFIRKGQRAATVELEFQDGRTLRWEKTAGAGGAYTISQRGEAALITRSGREQAPEVASFGIREFEVDGLKAWLQIDGQFDQPFMLSATGGQSAKLLAKVSKLDVLLNAQIMAHRDADHARREAKTVEADAARLAEEIASHPDYEALLEEWRDLEGEEADATARLEAIVAAERLLRRRGALLAVEAAWQASALTTQMAALTDRYTRLLAFAQLIQRLDQVGRELARQETTLAKARTDHAALEEELHGLLDGLTVCPVCGSVLKA